MSPVVDNLFDSLHDSLLDSRLDSLLDSRHDSLLDSQLDSLLADGDSVVVCLFICSRWLHLLNREECQCSVDIGNLALSTPDSRMSR